MLYLIKFIKLEPTVAVRKVYTREFTLVDDKGKNKVMKKTELFEGAVVDLVRQRPV